MGKAQGALGACLTAQGRYEEAESLLLHAHNAIKSKLGAKHRSTLQAVRWLTQLYEAWGKSEKAAEYRALLPETNSE